MSRIRKPTQLKILNGNPGKKPLNKNEPQPENSINQEPPDFLNDIAKKEWYIIYENLRNCGLVTKVDHSALAGYCSAYARWAEAEERLKTEGLTMQTINGNIIQSTYVGIANKSLMVMHKFLAEFGMTPSSRSRVTVNKEEVNEFSSFGKIAA